ncbi:Leucine Rich Repeat [Seminavis robusta]|uniref:Leucine Rich Repeat n=1 Tax=Seminavis robusta TaxID=568900 RepID=A0A9N8DN31_9STRA|nr:Leucine Rich Repeat [Seminavis robusta]|eukprot:Sro228_g092590.1 Leucine Rich Repeat (467) ;mRNA; f:23506-24906
MFNGRKPPPNPSGPQPGAHAQAGAPNADVEALQRATPAEPDRATETEGRWTNVPFLKQFERQDILCGSLIVCLLVTFVIVLAVALSIRRQPNIVERPRPTNNPIPQPPTSAPGPTSAPSSAPTMQPTTANQGLLASVLPTETLLVVRKNPNSPQAKAFDHVTANPSFSTFPEWRVLQRFALATFYYATRGNNWNVKDGWLQHDMDECQWFQTVTSVDPCSSQEGKLLHLRLRDNRLHGTVPPELFLMTYLKTIDLDMNAMRPSGQSRTIPTEIGLCTDLETLSLVHVHIGTVPTEVEQLTALKSLGLRGNRISPFFPDEILTLGSLTSLDLSRNWLLRFPSDLGQLNNLEVLDLGRNLMKQSLTTVVGNLTSLKRLSVQNNKLAGKLPPEIGLMTGLEELYLNGNQFSSRVPVVFEMLGALTTMNLEGNLLTGTIPESLCRLGTTNLTFDCNGDFPRLCGCDCPCL